MKYILYKNIKLSKLSLGTVQFGINYGISNKKGKPNQGEINNIISLLEEKGINSFDTAKSYGESEKVLGNYFKNDNISNRYVISKFDSKDLQLEEKKFLALIQESLSKLNITTLFGLLMHNSFLINNWEESFSNKVSLLKEKNMIDYFGVSIYSEEEFELALNNEQIDIIQIPFNILDQRAYKNFWFKKAKEKKKLLVIRSIYLQGLLLMDIDDIPEKLIHAKKYVKQLNEIASSLNITKNELCMSFVSTLAKDSLILFGCETIEQAKENISIFNKSKTLEKDIIKQLTNEFKNIDEKIYNPTKW